MKNHIENTAKKGLLLVLMMMMAMPKTMFAQTETVADTAGSADTGTAWENLFEVEEDEESGGKPYLFHFGNGILATYDTECAKQIGVKVGKPFPARGINKVGDYYAAMNMVDIAKVKNGELLRGFLGSNDKLYMNADAYEYNPGKPMLDPKNFGNYSIEEGGQPKVFRL